MSKTGGRSGRRSAGHHDPQRRVPVARRHRERLQAHMRVATESLAGLLRLSGRALDLPRRIGSVR